MRTRPKLRRRTMGPARHDTGTARRTAMRDAAHADTRHAARAVTRNTACSVARAVALPALLLALAAGPVLGQGPDRGRRPAIGPVPELDLPAVQEFALPNGLRVLLMEKHDLPLVQVDLHVDAGSVRDEAGKLGEAELTAEMLDEGAAGRGALEIADAFELLGARFSVGAGLHTATASLRVPVARLDDAIAAMADVVLRPDFPAAELDRLREERITYLVRQHDEPNAIAATLFARTLFGVTHPYGRTTIGDAASLAAITVDDLRDFHRRYYRPNNATLIVVGDVDAAGVRRRVEAAFGGWERGDVAAARVAAAPQVRGRTIYLVDKPGAVQSVIRIGRIGAQRTTDDYAPLLVLNTILGGSFTSRLNQNLREDKGYTYGASSAFDFRPAVGPFLAGAAVQTGATGPALREFMNELRGILQPIPEDEVRLARNFLAMRYPAGFQSVAGIAGRLGEVVQHGLPTADLERFTDRVLAVTPADVERVARQYIDPDNLAIIVVGDRQAIEAQLRELDLGEIRVLEVTDVLGPPPRAAEE